MPAITEIERVLGELVEERKRVDQVVREAHVVIKDLRGLLKETDKAEKKIKALAEGEVTGVVEPILKELIEKLSDQVGDTRDALVKKMFAMFEELTNSLFTGDKKGRGLDLRNLLKQIADAEEN